MAWSSLSPDVAPIEHLRNEFGRQVYACQPPPANDVNHLQRAQVPEGQHIPQKNKTKKKIGLLFCQCQGGARLALTHKEGIRATDAFENLLC